MKKVKTFSLILLILFISFSYCAQSQSGILKGIVVDKATGDPMIGARVMLKDTKKGGLTNVDGKFNIKNIEPGTYTAVITYVGYNKIEVTQLEFAPGQTKTINITMKEESLITEDVVVTAKRVMDNDAALLKERQKAVSFSDAIGAEEIARGGSSDAADAIKKVTGATTVDGKYVYIRGLGDRYSSTQLNGAQLPSADPDKKSVNFDLFPTDLIENITTTKTATPDKPGDFTGGTVDIRTKSFPDKFKMGFSVSSGYNTSTTGSSILTYPGSDSDWLGFDDGKRDIPEPIKEFIGKPDEFPQLNEAWSKNNPEKTNQLHEFSRAFDPVMSPTEKVAPLNHSFSFNVGDELTMLGEKFGYLASFSYGRNFDSYNDGVFSYFILPGSVDINDSLITEIRVDDMKSEDEVVWGAMGNFSYNINMDNKISVNYMYNQSGESIARYQFGKVRLYSFNQFYETRVLQFIERNISSLQINGEHNFAFLNNVKLDWNLTRSASSQDEPDLRFFTDDFSINYETGDTTFDIDQSSYKFPSRYFRFLDEELAIATLNLEIPFKEMLDVPIKFKTGLSYLEKTRAFEEHRFDFVQDYINYNGDEHNFFRDFTGVLDTVGNFIRFGNYAKYFDPRSSSYDGKQEVYAAYGMIDWYIFESFRIIGGVRYETTKLTTESRDSLKGSTNLNENDILPSVNFVYSLSEDMNFRLAYGKTLARPNFREFANYSSFEFIGGYTLIGNDSLNRTLIDNYDIRWEWFTNPGEILALSLFYKDFQFPLERVLLPVVTKEVQYRNVESATIFGAEFEFRKNLSFIDNSLENFLFGMNFTLVNSQVDIDPLELIVIKAYDPNAEETRSLQGQSPYVFNFDISYIGFESGTESSLNFNVFGKRLSEVTTLGNPDIFELPRPELNFIISQKIFENFRLKLSAKNLLDSEVKKVQEFKGDEYITQSYKYGRIFSLNISYSID